MMTMTLEKFCETLHLPIESIMRNFPERQEHKLRDLFWNDEEVFFDRLDSMRDRAECYRVALYLYTKWAVEVYPEYKKLGLSDRIYFDNFRDFKIWYDVCEKYYGVQGIREYNWVHLAIKLKIFRLGRLQFEPAVTDEEISFDGGVIPKGTAVLEVHIPEGCNLLSKEVQESFELSKVFFWEHFQTKYEYYHCESWLLAREDHEFMKEGCNILQFQRWFRVYKEVYDERQAEARVFGWRIMNPGDYPEDTSLQKSLKAYLLKGGSVGMGCGISLGRSFSE